MAWPTTTKTTTSKGELSETPRDDRDESPPHGGLSAVLPHRPKIVDRVLTLAERVHIPLLASALTFDALLAMIPLAVLLVQGLAWLLGRLLGMDGGNPNQLIVALLPTHPHGQASGDPFAMIEGLLETIRAYQSRFSWVAVPAFLWFGSRLFSSIRACLSAVFEAKQPQRHQQPVLDFLLGFLHGKLRDFGMMGVLLALALANTILSTSVRLLSADAVAEGVRSPFLASTLGQVLIELLAIATALLLFTLLYRYASPERMAWRGSLLAAAVATVGFEAAKRLYGWYLVYWAGGGVYAIDASIGAVLLFLLWVYWVSMVFLLGGAAAEVWEGGQAFD